MKKTVEIQDRSYQIGDFTTPLKSNIVSIRIERAESDRPGARMLPPCGNQIHQINIIPPIWSNLITSHYRDARYFKLHLGHVSHY